MLEGYFQKREISKLNHLIVQNYKALNEGRYAIKEEINRNIGEYLRQSLMSRLGVRTYVMVKTKKDARILYPAQLKKDFKDSPEDGDFSALPMKGLNYMEIAAENYRIMNEGLRLSVVVQIKHNSWLSNGILVFYVFLFVSILRWSIKKRIRETQRQETEQKELIQRLSHHLTRAESRLKDVEAKENNYLKKIAELNKNREDVSKDIDGLLEEMEQLEEGLEEQQSLKEEMQYEVLQLAEELDRLKGRLHKPGKKQKKIDATNKRFRVLYKNLAFTERAIEGFLALTDEFQLKAEQVAHKLNEDDSLISVKRKVFGKGGKMNILEVDFSYSGRIYFQKDSQHKTRILAIGTKNTQDQDLAFIEKAK
jgi:hypothetical protein